MFGRNPKYIQQQLFNQSLIDAHHKRMDREAFERHQAEVAAMIRNRVQGNFPENDFSLRIPDGESELHFETPMFSSDCPDKVEPPIFSAEVIADMKDKVPPLHEPTVTPMPAYMYKAFMED